MNTKYLKYSVLFVLILTVDSCVWLGEYYVGMTLQPELDENEFQLGLNVFGILKTGEDLDSLNHWFEVQLLTSLSGDTDTLIPEKVNIKLIRNQEGMIPEQHEPTYDHDGIFRFKDLNIAPGDKWTYTCTYDTLSVYSSCTIPELPRMADGSFRRDSDEVAFQLVCDTSVSVYDLYLIAGKEVKYDRISSNRKDNPTVRFELRNYPTEEPLTIYAFAYDQNFSRYFSTSGIFFKPNAYRPQFSTVTGGFGVFGAVSGSRFIQGN